MAAAVDVLRRSRAGVGMARPSKPLWHLAAWPLLLCFLPLQWYCRGSCVHRMGLLSVPTGSLSLWLSHRPWNELACTPIMAARPSWRPPLMAAGWGELAGDVGFAEGSVVTALLASKLLLPADLAPSEQPGL